jgi:hypothetical protein
VGRCGSRAVGCPHRRHAVRRRCRPARSPHVGGMDCRRPREVALPIAARRAAHAARRHSRLPGSRCRLGVREGHVRRSVLDDRRATRAQLRAAPHERGTSSSPL